MPFIKWSLALIIVVIAETTQSKTATVDWLSPKEGDTFYPGDRITGTWGTEKPILSLSFRLCPSSSKDPESKGHGGSEDVGEDNNTCGPAIWPPVTQNAGSYSISLVAPKMQSQAKYILRMESESGAKYQSPTFSLGPWDLSVVTETDLPVAELPQAPLGSKPSEGSITRPAVEIYPAAGLIPGGPRPPLDNPTTPATNGSFPGSPLGSTIPPTAVSAPHVLIARRAVATAAYAIPLSVFVAILFVVGGLAIRHRYKLQQERRNNEGKLSLSRQSSWNCKSVGDVERALNTLAREDVERSVPAPVPLFMPVEVQLEPKRSIRKPFPTSQYSTSLVRDSANVSRLPAIRSILSPDYHLPPIVPSSAGFFNDHDAVTHSVISSYFKPSPPVSPSSMPSIPGRLHIPHEIAARSNHDNKPLPWSPH